MYVNISLYTPRKTNSLHLKMGDPWKKEILNLETSNFRFLEKDTNLTHFVVDLGMGKISMGLHSAEHDSWVSFGDRCVCPNPSKFVMNKHTHTSGDCSSNPKET